MRFALSDEQILMQQTVRAALQRACPPAAVRAAWQDGPSRERWQELARAGLVGLLVAEANGGQGLGELELAVALEEAGRVALPEPLLEGSVVGPLLPERWQSKLAAGDAVVTLGLAGAPFVADAEAADLLVLEDHTGLHALERKAVKLEPVRSVDGARHLSRVEWRREDGVALGPTGELADRAALAAAAMLVGLARRMLEMTVEYVKVRHQFGRPVGSFQAVKHHLAGALGRVELAAPTVLRAAYAMSRREPARAARVSMAKAMTSDAATAVARAALQCHGAIGYTVEHDLHMWMKRAWALAAAWGDAAWHRARLAVAVLDGGLDLEMGES